MRGSRKVRNGIAEYPVAFVPGQLPTVGPRIIDDRSLANHIEANLSAIWGAVVTKEHQYTPFFIRRNGKARLIHKPSRTLGYLQYMLLHKVLDKLPVHEHVIAYVPGRSCAYGAAKHTNQKVVLSMDISNFFNSVKRAQVRRALMNYFPKNVAHLIAELTTCDNFVPQGAATSGAVANLVGQHTFDTDILDGLPGWTYTRYSDDITLSRHDCESEDQVHKAADCVERALEKYSFKVNPKKTRWTFAPARQVVLGLQVNTGVCLPRKKYHEIRATLNKAAELGVAVLAKQQKKEEWQVENYLRGLMSYVNSVDAERHKLLVPVYANIPREEKETEEKNAE